MELLKQLGMTVITALPGANGKETALGAAVSSAGIMITGWLGGWDIALKVLLTLMAADYGTGLLAACKLRKVNSDVMFWGGIRKTIVLFVIGLAASMDAWFQPGEPIFRTAAIYFYVSREAISVFENLGALGVPLPQKLRSALEQLNRDKEEDAHADINSGRK